MGLTREMDGQLGLPVPTYLATDGQAASAYLTHWSNAIRWLTLSVVRALAGCQAAWPLLDQFLQRMLNQG